MEGKEVIIMGDFNVNYKKKETHRFCENWDPYHAQVNHPH